MYVSVCVSFWMSVCFAYLPILSDGIDNSIVVVLCTKCQVSRKKILFIN